MLARLHLLERSSYYCILIAGLLLIAGRQPSLAQVFDDFEDGDFTSAPAWVGTTDRWQIVDVDGTRMLNSAGRTSADTLHLATRSETAYGSWEFRFSRSGVNLSNFNGTRVFLVADVPNLAGNVRGYFLQIGTNNAKDIRLVRIDGDPSSRRVEIGRSEAGIAEGDTADVRFRVERDELSRWTVFADDELIIQAEDDRYQASNWFGFWVKHTSTTGSGYFFDDVGVTPGATPAPPSTEATAEAIAPQRIRVQFSEPILAISACMPVHYSLSPPLTIANVTCEQGDIIDHVELHLDRGLAVRRYDLAIDGLVHENGLPLPPLHVSIDVKEEQVRAFAPVAAIYNHRFGHVLQVRFNRAVDATTVLLDKFSLNAARVHVVDVSIAGATVIDLTLSDPLEPGEYSLTIGDIWSGDGQSWRGELDFLVMPLPDVRDLVVNEIHFAPPDQKLEFIEIYNRSDIEIDLSYLDFSDDRLQATPITDMAWLLPPGGLATIVADSIAFREAFPAARNIRQPPVWHTLNNSGDAVILYAGAAAIDSVAYSSSWTTAARSIERIDPDGPSSRFNFAPSADPWGATPGERNSVYAPVTEAAELIAAQEIQASNSRQGRIALYFNRPIDLSAGSPLISIAGNRATSLTLIEDSVVVAEYVGDRPTDAQVSGLIDVFGFALRDTTAEVSTLPRPGDLVFNEIMFTPRADPFDNLPDQPEYIEFINQTPFPLNVSNILIADEPDETGGFRSIPFSEPLRTLAPETYLVVAAEPAGRDAVNGALMIEEAFASTDFRDPSITLMVSRRNTLNLPNAGKTVRLLRADSLEIDRFSYHPGLHHRGVESYVGLALERVDTTLPADDEHNWTTSVSAEGGTPGRVNSVVSGAPTTESPGIAIDPKVFSPDADGRPGHASIGYTLQAPGAHVRIHIFDSRGRLVRRIAPPSLSGSSGSLLWDGRDDDGRRLRIGIYVVVLEAVDLDNGRTEAYRDVVVLARPLG